jgi:hypothetical protein
LDFEVCLFERTGRAARSYNVETYLACLFQPSEGEETHALLEPTKGIAVAATVSRFDSQTRNVAQISLVVGKRKQ